MFNHMVKYDSRATIVDLSVEYKVAGPRSEAQALVKAAKAAVGRDEPRRRDRVEEGERPPLGFDQRGKAGGFIDQYFGHQVNI